MWNKMKWIITKIMAIPMCLILGDFKFKSYNDITWDDTWEVLRIGGELLIIASGFALPPILIFPWYFRIPVWIATIAIMFVFLHIEHKRYVKQQQDIERAWKRFLKRCR